MTNTGKELEKIVVAIEAKLMPSGFTVEQNKKIFDENGIQEVEFDIVLSGPLGSGKYKCLIECRHRPSQGTMGRDWIEQLDGRRRAGDFNNVMAVSTTGFSPSAKKIAKKLGIDLRELNGLISGVDAWFPIPGPCLVRGHSGRIVGLIFDGVKPQSEDQLNEVIRMSQDDKMWELPILRTRGQMSSAKKILDECLQDTMEGSGAPTKTGEIKNMNLTVDLSRPEDRTFIVTEFGDVVISALNYQMEVELIEEEIPVKYIRQYSTSEGRPVAQRMEVPGIRKWAELSVPFRVPEALVDGRTSYKVSCTMDVENETAVICIFFDANVN